MLLSATYNGHVLKFEIDLYLIKICFPSINTLLALRFVAFNMTDEFTLTQQNFVEKIFILLDKRHELCTLMYNDNKLIIKYNLII